MNESTFAWANAHPEIAAARAVRDASRAKRQARTLTNALDTQARLRLFALLAVRP